MIVRDATVTNALGLHARAAARFVRLASSYQARIQIGRDGQMMDGKSIMGILLLAASHGTVLTIAADGADESAAIDALVTLVESGLGEPACTD